MAIIVPIDAPQTGPSLDLTPVGPGRTVDDALSEQAEPETFESELRSFAETPEQAAFVEKLIAPHETKAWKSPMTLRKALGITGDST